MSFKPKYFGMEAEGPVGRMVAELKSEDIKGNVNKAIIEGNGNNAQLVEFDLKSKWFHDIYDDVLYPMGGSFSIGVILMEGVPLEIIILFQQEIRWNF